MYFCEESCCMCVECENFMRFLSWILFLFMLIVCVKWVWSITHRWEGRDAWVKGLVGLTHVVEKLLCGDDFDVFQWSMDLWFLAFLGGIRRCMKKEYIVKPWKGMLLMRIFEYMWFMDLKFSSWRDPTFTLYLDSMEESMCEPWDGLYCVVIVCMVYECEGVKPFVSYFPKLGGWPPWGLGWEVSLHGSTFCLLFAGICFKSWTFGSCEVLPLHRRTEHYCICIAIEDNSIFVMWIYLYCRNDVIDFIHMPIERLRIILFVKAL